MVWNSLPSDCLKANSFQSFKMKLKNHICRAVKYFLVDLFVCFFLLTSFLFYVVKIFV